MKDWPLWFLAGVGIGALLVGTTIWIYLYRKDEREFRARQRL